MLPENDRVGGGGFLQLVVPPSPPPPPPVSGPLPAHPASADATRTKIARAAAGERTGRTCARRLRIAAGRPALRNRRSARSGAPSHPSTPPAAVDSGRVHSTR